MVICFAEVYFTGSYPLPPQGWQRKIRLIVIQLPFAAPYLFMASRPYCEHVGVNLHDGFSKGDMAYW